MPLRNSRLLDAAMGNWQFERRHVYPARLRWALAAIAVLVVLSEGFYSLLFWMPSSWGSGSVNEDGDRTTNRRTASGMLALAFTALAFAAACARAEHAREREP